MSLKYNRDIQMKFNVPRLFLSENMVYFVPLFIGFIENLNKECPLIKVK